MHDYEFRYVRNDCSGKQSYRFRSVCLGGALDIARRDLEIAKGRLYEDGRPVCFLELVSGTGVWLVGAPTLVDDDLRPCKRDPC